MSGNNNTRRTFLRRHNNNNVNNNHASSWTSLAVLATCCVLLLSTTSVNAIPTISVDKTCYDSSGSGSSMSSSRMEITTDILVSFGDLTNTEGVWIGLYESNRIVEAAVSRTSSSDPVTLPILPSHDDPAQPLKQWVLTCGMFDGCPEPWMARGQVSLSALSQPSGSYVVVVSGDAHNPLQAQAISVPFNIIDEATGETCLQAATGTGGGDRNSDLALGGGSGSVTLPVDDMTFPTPAPPASFPTTSPTANPTVAATPVPTSVPTPTPPPKFIVEDSFAFTAVEQTWINIRRLISDNQDLLGIFLRLSFHDCVGGCDGCVDLTDPDNKGLDFPIELLDNVVASLPPNSFITRADVWAMAAMAANQMSAPPDRGVDFVSLNNFQWFGRPTCEMKAAAGGRTTCGTDSNGNTATCTSTTGPFVPLCHGTAGTQEVLEFFEDSFGFNAQQVTAIMGAHSVGRMNRQNSGFTGTWDLSQHALDMGYWLELVAGPNFEIRTIPNNDIPGVPDRLLWRAEIADPNVNVNMLNSDIALVRNIPSVDQVSCNFFDCDPNTPFRPHIDRYVNDFTQFLFEYRDVMNIMVDFGNNKPIQCPGGRICSYSGVASRPVEEMSLTLSSDPPSLSPDKSCYTPGIDISAKVSFSQLAQPLEGVWIGIYNRQDLFQDDFTQLPALETNLLIKWILPCGQFDTCDMVGWPTQGTVVLLIDDLPSGDYMVVASGHGGSTRGQAGAAFQIGGCTA
mmetsp:Transcript_14698/g.35875  ORF Transcript_14698/g.35875 Transcript_14698/m.35875 type:complete len:737 (-) Transcript_14698:3317-5527(-)